jgi:hypothetical protein
LRRRGGWNGHGLGRRVDFRGQRGLWRQSGLERQGGLRSEVAWGDEVD